MLLLLALVSYSVYLLHPVLIELYDRAPGTKHENFVPMELLMIAVFLLVLLVCCGLTRRFIEAPLQRLGRRAAGRLDVRFGPDVLRGGNVGPECLAASSRYLTRWPGSVSRGQLNLGACTAAYPGRALELSTHCSRLSVRPPA